METIKIIEYVAVISGMLHVFLLTRGKVLAWPFGLLSVSLYIFIFLQNKLYSDTFLHVIYVVLNIYGWDNWSRNQGELKSVEVTTLDGNQKLGWTAMILAGFLIWGYGIANNTDASYPYGDAFTTVASLVAQYLLARRKLENWIIWIIVDVVAINIYLRKGLYPTSGLYAVYFLLSAWGWWNWRQLYREQITVDT